MATIRFPRQAIPRALTAFAPAFKLMYLEVVNNTAAEISFEVWDAQSLCVIPLQPVAAGATFAYKVRYGNQATGLSWKATAKGLVGWCCGDSIA